MDARDYIVIGFYLALMAALGVVFRRFSKDTSDYFRGGGTMLWWLTGSSATMAALSAWSFTGAAGEIYETGPLIAVLYLSNALSLVVVYAFTCERFRRMRVVTYVEAVRRRFGEGTGRLYLWGTMPIALIFAGIQLYAVSVFFAAVFHAPVTHTIVGLSGIVIVMAMLGGSWAVIVGDFLQLLMILLLLAVAAFYALRAPGLGGVAGLLQKVPAGYFHWSQYMRPGILVLWAAGTLINALVDFNNIGTGAARFLCVKDGRHARWAALAMIAVFGFIIVFLFIPPMVAAVLLPDLKSGFPNLPQPSSAAYVAICFRTMPHGVIGLLAAGIFAVAMAAMDTGLNRNVGLFIRNFYALSVRPRAKERELVFASKVCTVAFGLFIMAVAWWLVRFGRTMSLFSLVQMAISLVQFPMYLPLVLGVFVRRGPKWVGWSAAVLGVVIAFLAKPVLFPAFVAMTGWDALSAREVDRLSFGLTILAVTLAQAGWYAAVRFLFPQPAAGAAAQFFRDQDRPIDVATEMTANDDQQYVTVGRLCLVYGGGIAALAAMPNSAAGRATFGFFGGVIVATGVALLRAGRRRCGAAPVALPAQAGVGEVTSR